MVDGERHGHWILRFADGQVGEGPYVGGNKHGRWVVRFADGGVDEFCYENGNEVDCRHRGHRSLDIAAGSVR